MIKRVLDTTTLSQLMKGEPTAVRHLEALSPPEVLVPQPVIAEIAYGLARLPDSARKARLEKRFGLVLDRLARAEWNDEVSLRFGAIKALLEQRGQPLEDFDIAIAAHALAQGAVLVTANVRHMQRVPELALETWE